MTGCLTFPLRLLASLLLILGLVAGWVFREDLLRAGRRQLGLAEPPSRVGAPSPQALTSAQGRLEALAAGRADSVVLSPSEVASLLADLLSASPAGAPESLTVELGDRELSVRARVATAPIPEPIRDLLGNVLGERETVEVGGQLGLRREGQGEFDVRRVRVKGFPVPADLVGRLLGRYLPATEGSTVLFGVPLTVSGILVTPQGATLYGRGNR